MRNTYRAWAFEKLTRRPAAKRDYQDALFDRSTFELMEATGLPGDEAAWLAGVTAQLRYTHPDCFADGDKRFLYVWASLSPSLSKGMHINQARFERWLSNISHIENWYENSIEALRVTRGHSFDVASLYDLAKMRADGIEEYFQWESMRKICATDFFCHQPKGMNGKIPTQQSLETLLVGEIGIALGGKLTRTEIEQAEASIAEIEKEIARLKNLPEDKNGFKP